MTPSQTRPTKTLVLAAIIAVQAASAAFFVSDWFRDVTATATPTLTWHMMIELFATISLTVAIAVEVRVLLRLLRREAHMMRSLSVASQGFHDLMEQHFADWGLTPAEVDVATFLVKGIDTPEIARLRGSAEGTIKAHLNAIYRKAGVSGRPGLLSLLIEELLAEPLIKSGSQAVRDGAAAL